MMRMPYWGLLMMKHHQIQKQIFSALKTIQSTMESVDTGINKMGDAFTALAAANPQQKVTDQSSTSLSAHLRK